MARVKRYDRGTLKSPVRMPNGWMKLDGFLTRTGVFEYLNADGSVRREYRAPEEVFHPDALASFGLVPLTNGHPDEPLTAENTAKFQVGTVGESVVKDGDLVRAAILVTNADAIAALEGGREYLSCGYEADLVMEEGVSPEGERYDGRQTNIRGNHVALVDVPRAGPVAHVRLDNADAVQVASLTVHPPRGPHMSKIRVDGVEVEVPETAAALIEKALKVASDAVEAEKARADAAASGLAKAQAELAEAPAKIRAELSARMELESTARKVLGSDAKFDGKTQRQVKVETLTAMDSRVDFSKKSDAYVDAAFDFRTAEYLAEDPQADAAEGQAKIEAARVDEDLVAKARAKFLEALNDAHKRK